MNLQTYTLGLMITSLISIFLMATVIKKQYSLSKLKIDHDLKHFRCILVGFSFIILLGILISIGVDIYILINQLDTLYDNKQLGFVYAVSNGITDLASAYLIWLLYRKANT